MWAATLILGLIFPPSLFATIPLWGLWFLIGMSKQKRNEAFLDLMRQEEVAKKTVYDAYVQAGGEALSSESNGLAALSRAAQGYSQFVIGDKDSGYKVNKKAIKEFNRKALEARLARQIREAGEEATKAEEAKALAKKQEIHQGLRKKAFEKVEFYCESPAELEFLKAVIQEFGLTIGENEFAADGIHLKNQVQINGYRVDFLFNSKFIVEIDGHEYHSGRENATRDAHRDGSLRSAGYRILRIPAYRVFHSPSSAVADVRDFLEL